MKKIIDFIRNHYLFILTVIFYCFIQYLFYFYKGSIVLGGEGNYFLDFNLYIKKTFTTWERIATGTGQIFFSTNAFFSLPLLLSLFDNVQVVSYVLIFSFFCLPFITSYFLMNKINPGNKRLSLFVAIFYVINPFSVNYLYALNPWNVNVLFVFPLYFLIILSLYHSDLKLFLYFGLTSALVAYANANPPQMIILNSSLVVFIYLVQLIKFNKLNLFTGLKKTIILYTSLFIFNLWWIFNWFLVLNDAKKLYSTNFAKDWLQQVSAGLPYVIKGIFSLTWINQASSEFNFFSYYFHLPFIEVFLFIPFLLIFYWLLRISHKSSRQKIILNLIMILTLTIVLLKGYSPPFKQILLFCFDQIPYCSIFKTAVEKFGVPFIFYFSLLLFYVLHDISKRRIMILFYVYLAICLFPFLSGKYIPDQKITGFQIGSRKFYDLPEYKEFRKKMNSKKLDQRILSLPNGGNYQVMMNINGYTYYTGMDPILSNIPQPFIADYSSLVVRHLFDTIKSKYHSRILSLYNIGNIHFNKRLISWYGNTIGLSLNQEEKLLNIKYPVETKYNKMTLYKNPYYLPHIYTPRVIINTSKKLAQIKEIVSQDDYQIRTAINFAQ